MVILIAIVFACLGLFWFGQGVLQFVHGVITLLNPKLWKDDD